MANPVSTAAYRATLAVALLTLLSAGVSRAVAVRPSSPEVQELVKKGLEFLSKDNENRLGGQCVVGLAFLKSTPPQRDHPKVKEALEACRAAARQGNPLAMDMYSNGLAIIFLCELNPRTHSSLINYFLGALKQRQKDHGGWGYEGRPTGDTSQSQYGAFSYWEAHKNGFAIESSSAERFASWLVRTQDPSGVWGYQGKLGSSQARVEQDETSCSMLAAGMGSILIGADLFGLLRGGSAAATGPSVPSVLRVAGEVERKRAPNLRSATLDRSGIVNAIKDGESWMEKNYKKDIGRYNIYYLYGLERYKSFYELFVGESVEEPEWYNNGYEYLRRKQLANGSWSAGCGPGPDTAFAILFLVRSTKQILKPEPLIDLRVGRRGLPKAAANVKLVAGRFVVEQTEAAVGDLLNILDGDAAARLDALADDPTALAVVGEVDETSATRLRQIVRGGSPAARLIAVRTLAQTGDLDHVPTLIFALTDPDRQVTLAARDGLRFVSRRFGGFGLGQRYDEKQRYAAIEKWKNWYLSIRPGAIVTLN